MPKALSHHAVCLKVAELLREERDRQGLSLNAVATRAGLSYQMVSYVERGMRVPGLETLLRLAAALKVDPAELLKRAMIPQGRASAGGQATP